MSAKKKKQKSFIKSPAGDPGKAPPQPKSIAQEAEQVTSQMAGGKALDESLADLVRKIRKEHGPEAVQTADKVQPVKRLPTGLAKLDKILRGGWPMGRVVEVWGPQSAGKTTLLFRTIAAIQAADSRARIAYLDLENTFDTEWAVKCGINLKRLLHVKAVTAERAGDLLLRLVRNNWTMVIIDSLVELIPKDVLEKETGKSTYAPVANVLSALLPKVVVLQSNSPTIVVMVNQVRDIIGFFLGRGKKSPGGNALYHIDSLKLRVQRKEPIWGSLLTPGWAKHLEQIGVHKPKPKKEYGYVMAIKVVKSKVSREGEMCLLPVLFDIGIVEEAVKNEAATDVSAAGSVAGAAERG